MTFPSLAKLRPTDPGSLQSCDSIHLAGASRRQPQVFQRLRGATGCQACGAVDFPSLDTRIEEKDTLAVCGGIYLTLLSTILPDDVCVSPIKPTTMLHWRAE